MSNPCTDPNPKKALEPTPKTPLEAAEERVEEATTAWVLEKNVAKFREEFQRLDRGYRDHENNYPIWKFALGGDESRLVDQAIEAQREREYDKPYAFVCDESDFKLLCVCRDLLEADRGCCTPAEEFIWSLLMRAKSKPLTPEVADDELKNFRDNFQSEVETTKRFLARYPDLFEAKQEQEQ